MSTEFIINPLGLPFDAVRSTTFLDATYLRLDASNDPITGQLALNAGAKLLDDQAVTLGTDDDALIRFNSSNNCIELLGIPTGNDTYGLRIGEFSVAGFTFPLVTGASAPFIGIDGNLYVVDEGGTADGQVYVVGAGTDFSSTTQYGRFRYISGSHNFLFDATDSVDTANFYFDAPGTTTFDTSTVICLDGLSVTGTTTLDTGLTGFLKAASGVVSAASIDISDDTNLAVTSPVTLTGDTLSFDFSVANTFTGLQTFDAGAHFNDNDYLSFGNTFGSADARIYSDGADLCFNTSPTVSTFGFSFDAFDLTGTGFNIPTLRPLAGAGLMNFAYTLYIQDPNRLQDGFLYLPKKSFNATTDSNLLSIRYDSANDDALFVASGPAIPTMTFQAQGNIRFKPLTGVIEIDANDDLNLDGATGNYKIVHNSTNSSVEIYAGGTLVAEFT